MTPEDRQRAEEARKEAVRLKAEALQKKTDEEAAVLRTGKGLTDG